MHSGTGPAKLVRGRLTGRPGGEPIGGLLPAHSKSPWPLLLSQAKVDQDAEFVSSIRESSQLQMTYVKYRRGPGSAAYVGHDEAREQQALEGVSEGGHPDDTAHTDPAFVDIHTSESSALACCMQQ